MIPARWLALSLALSPIACGAVFPEITPSVRVPPPGRELLPPPPADVVFIAFQGAEIPPRTRDGRQWDSIGGNAPDPFAKLIVDGREILRTPVQSNTLKPTWPGQRLANYRVDKGARAVVEVWDSNAINNHPICIKTLGDLQEEASTDPIEIDCESGAHVTLRVEPAHSRWGLGFSYELRTIGVAVTGVLAESPAARVGIVPNDEVLEIQGKKVDKMEEGEAQSLINSNAQIGVTLLLRTQNQAPRTVKVADGVIYPVVTEGIAID
jgi:membrane-associated protease RseP (regulator of RpoE activity)